MLNNYRYFLVLAEELNISNAAKRMFISHQCLSKYLKSLEAEYGVSFFERKPRFTLTSAGQIMLSTLKQIELAEQNLESQLADVKSTKTGTIRFGITEGRYPILIPKLLKEFRVLYPDVQLIVKNMTSPEMMELILNNDLDLFFSGTRNLLYDELKCDFALKEDMFLVISDNLLKQYFPDTYPLCRESFKQGADLCLFQEVPFVLNKPNFNSRIMLDQHLSRLGISLNCINVMTQPDMHYRLCAEDYAASFCLTMYLPDIYRINQSGNTLSPLNVFRIKDFDQYNMMSLIYHKNKIFPTYTQDFMKLVKKHCSSYANLIVPTTQVYH